MDPYLLAAAVLAWACLVVLIVAFFIGRDRMIDDLRHQWQEDR